MNYEEYIKRDLPIVLDYDRKYENYEWDELNKLGDENDPVALYEIGYRYCNGEKTEINEAKGVEYLERLLDIQKHTGAMYEIGWYYAFEGDSKDQKKSIDYFKVGSEYGDGRCTRRFGDLYCYGKGLEQSYEKAKEFYLKAIDQGEIRAYSNIGCVCVVEEEYDKALEYFQTGYSKTTGEERAEFAYRLAQLYWNEYGVEEDYDKMFKLLQEASEGGLKEEINGMLCYCYGYGKGTEQNTEKALECLNNLSEADRATCTYICGDCLRKEKKWEEAIPYLQEAANLGQKDAIKIMDEKSTDQEYLAKRSEEGSAIAMAKLSCLLIGGGKGEDFDKAIELAKKAYSIDKDNEFIKWNYCVVLSMDAHIRYKIGGADLVSYKEYLEIISVIEQIDFENDRWKDTKDTFNNVYFEGGMLALSDKEEDVALTLLKKADRNKYPYSVALIAEIHSRNYLETNPEGSLPRSKELDQDIIDLREILNSENFENDFQKAHTCLELATIYLVYKEGDKAAYEEGYRLCKKAYALDPEMPQDLLNIYVNEMNPEDVKRLNSEQGQTDGSKIKDFNTDNSENADDVDAPKKGVNINIIVIVCILVFMIILIKYGLDQSFDKSQLPPATASPVSSVDTSSEVAPTQSQTVSRESTNRSVATVEGGETLNDENDIVVAESADSTTSEVNSFAIADPDDLYVVDSVSNKEELIGLLNLIAYDFSNSYRYDDIGCEETAIKYLTAGIWEYHEYNEYYGTYKDDQLRNACEYHENDGFTDPLNKYYNTTGYGFYKYDANEVEKVAMDVFNCSKDDLIKIRESIAQDWLYYYDGYYYLAYGEGDVESENVDIWGILTDGKLYYVFYTYSYYDYEEYIEDPENYIAPLEDHFAIVEQKEDQGREYWSIYATDNMIERGIGDKLFGKMWNY